MHRSSLIATSVVLLGTAAFAQTDLRSNLYPITSKVKHAGVLNLDTGTWTRAGSSTQNLVPGMDIVYANTCNTGYYGGQTTGEIWIDEGEIPNNREVQIANPVIAGGIDKNTGCQLVYQIQGFEIAYCTYQLAIDVTLNFFDMYEAKGGAPCQVPGAPVKSFNLTTAGGFPASTTVNVQACWIVSLRTDVADYFNLTGTDSGGLNNINLFGWSWATNNLINPALPDRPIIAGNFAVCTGTDSTRWDRGTASVGYPGNYDNSGNIPINIEEGSGMNTFDAFRIDGATSAPSGPGCYYFGGNPYGSFHLELYSTVQCATACNNPPVNFCFGNADAGPCPCALSPQNPVGGCANESGTSGAELEATVVTGVCPSVSDDSDGSHQVQLTMTNAPAFKTSLFIQGNTLITPANFYDGRRCVGGQLVRLNGFPTPPGDPTDGAGTVTYPAGIHTDAITIRSAASGDPIAPGSSRHYFVHYRDPNPNNCNVSLGGTANISSATTIRWGP
jgi:hypothetical protein